MKDCGFSRWKDSAKHRQTVSWVESWLEIDEQAEWSILDVLDIFVVAATLWTGGVRTSDCDQWQTKFATHHICRDERAQTTTEFICTETSESHDHFQPRLRPNLFSERHSEFGVA